MRAACLLGVFLFLPAAGHAVRGGAAPPGVETLLSLPDLSGITLPQRVEPDLLSAPGAAGLSQPASEFDLLGEELHDAVASPVTLAWFQEAIRDPDSKKRVAAVEAFGYRGNFAAIPYVSAVLLRVDEESSVRAAAARALGRIADRRAWRFLAPAVCDRDAGVRFAAVMALGQIPGGGNAHLEKVLRGDPSWLVRYAAAVAMGRARGPRAAGWLKRAASMDEVWQVRFQAVLALGELGTLDASAALAGPLRDSQPMVRAAAGLALARFGAAGGGRALLARALELESDRGVRAVLSWALERAKARGI